MLFESLFRKDRAVLAVLIDPDKTDTEQFKTLLSLLPVHCPDLILIGGSGPVNKDVSTLVDEIRSKTHAPIVLFPGSPEQLSANADGLFLCSLISGRNPEFLIGRHVKHAFEIASLEIAVWPVGYVLLEGHRASSTSQFTHTTPLSINDRRTILQTAVAGELLGMKAIYLEAGSGADHAIAPEIVSLVSEAVQIPVIVGGGIQNKSDVSKALTSGASMVVIGTALEENPLQLPMFIETAVQHCLV